MKFKDLRSKKLEMRVIYEITVNNEIHLLINVNKFFIYAYYLD